MAALFEVQHCSLAFDEKPVLQGLTLHVEAGEFLGILGPNGSGKTTLLKIMAGVLRHYSGTVRFQQKEIRAYSHGDLARKIAVLPQEQWIDFPFSAYEVVLMGRAPYLKNFQWEGPEDHRIAREAMERTDVWPLAAQDIRTLSGGERERVLLARALAQQPQVLLLDEPTTHVDLKHQAQMLRLLKQLQAQGLTVVVVLHDLNFASLACDRLAILGDRRLAAEGRPEQVLVPEKIEALFGVRVRGEISSTTGRPIFIPDLGEP